MKPWREDRRARTEAEALFRYLRTRGVEFSFDRGSCLLSYKAPPGVLTGELVADMRRLRVGLGMEAQLAAAGGACGGIWSLAPSPSDPIAHLRRERRATHSISVDRPEGRA